MGILRRMFNTIAKSFVDTPKLKGTVGEIKVDSTLNPWFFGKVEHRQINNLILVDDKGKSHQIDHIEIRQNGIFCIETKNFSGYIYGSENQTYWIQCLYRERHQFLNPIKQNKSHVYCLREALGFKYDVHSVVVFVQNNADTINAPGVVNLRNLKYYLNSFSSDRLLSIEEMDEVYNKLMILANKQISNKEHISNIQQTQKEIRNKICPRCGASLVLRNGKYGEFYGCSNYPKCKFILKNKVYKNQI